MTANASAHDHQEPTAATRLAPEPPTQKESLTNEHKRVLGGAMVGTTIEWFDFFIYAQAAGLIFATQYFNPATNDNPSLAQIISWASLGVSFLFRCSYIVSSAFQKFFVGRC
ncbi:transporter [Corynebacterium pilosum]|uniref:Transporter n=1 Tax=Corynebacterium pilosum TaxID=35756 RepID=A0A376CPN6_9CORY|nr:transporter [Corynebacterium pilosum]